jgi:hypothetical protein
MKQLLIEKYIKPSKIVRYGNKHFSEIWKNEYEEMHSIFDHPSEVYYFEEQVTAQYWHKNGKQHRDKNKPAGIIYIDEKVNAIGFYKNGKRTKEIFS